MADSKLARFLYEGNRLNDDDTPATLEMEDGDTIDVMVERACAPYRLVSPFRP